MHGEWQNKTIQLGSITVLEEIVYQTASNLPMSRSSQRNLGGNRRGWWREFFLDHPGFLHRPVTSESHVSGKVKAYCKLCFNGLVFAEKERDRNLLQAGAISEVRLDSIIHDTCKDSFLHISAHY